MMKRMAHAPAATPAQAVEEAAATNLKTVQALARRLLWIAYCWNDHNFDKSPLDYALEEAEQHGINSFEEANALIEQMKREQEAQPTSEQHAKLMKFYGVSTLLELVDTQARSIERLQERVHAAERPFSFAPQRVREG